MYPSHAIKFFSCRGSEYLASKIVASFGGELGKISVLEFSDGEFQPSLDESVRGKTVFIIQSTFPPIDNLMELLLTIDAAKRASAYKVIAVIPYFGWARQDRKDRSRISIGAKLVANLLCAAGVDRVMTIDLHADQIQGFFDIPVDILYATGMFLPYLRGLNVPNLSIAAPDVGGAKRANVYAKSLAAPLILCHKYREKANYVSEMKAIGDVEGRNIIIIDDLVDTAETMCKAADMLMERGATSVRAIATHAVLSGNAYENLENSKILELVTTDTIPLKKNISVSKIKIISSADFLAEVIGKVYNCQSISASFVM